MPIWPSEDLERLMIADAEGVAKLFHEVSPAADLCCHVKALLGRVRELETALRASDEMLRDVAWHAAGYGASWSDQDILAHVADHFGTTVGELAERMKEAAG